MLTSDGDAAPAVAGRTILLESVAAGVMVLAVTLLLAPDDAGVRLPGPHLAWIAVLLLAARYGINGLCLSLPVSAAIVATTAAVLGNARALGERLDGGADLVALVTAVLVGWIASTQESRRGELASKLDAERKRALADRKAAREMQDALVALRSRADRMNLSLSFLRMVAERLEGGDPEDAASAALTLAMTCLEARAGAVALVGPAGAPSLLAWAGPWNGNGSAPALEGDQVVAAALDTRSPAQAAYVDSAGPGDADMVAPLLDRHGDPIGVLAVRGLPYRAAAMMALRDLTVVSGWLANVLTQPRRTGAAETNDAGEDDRDEAPYLELSLSSDLGVQSSLSSSEGRS